MRPWTSAIGIVVSSLSGSVAPDCPNETLGTAASDSRRMTKCRLVHCVSPIHFICFSARRRRCAPLVDHPLPARGHTRDVLRGPPQGCAPAFVPERLQSSENVGDRLPA